MKKKNIIFVTFVILVFSISIFADSPLRSNAISETYQDIAIVKKAAESNGKLTKEIMEFISDLNNPVDIKIATINALVWLAKTEEDEDEVKFSIFLDYLIADKKYANENEFLKNGTGDELLAMAYFQGLNFSNNPNNDIFTKNVFRYADLALQKNPKSWTYNIVVRLVKAEKFHFAIDEDCQAFNITNEIRNSSDLVFDMRPKAKELIYRYMDQYQEDCPK